MGLIISKPFGGFSNGADVPCTTTSTYLPTTTSSTYIKLGQVTSTTSKAVPTTTSSKPVTTSTSSAPVSTTPATFYLKSSCDNSCIGHFAADDQIFSNLYSSTDATFDSFYISNGVLYDASTSTFCVSSEAAGTDTRFQCSNDADYINGVAVANVWSTSNNLLTLNGASTWYGCGTVDLANNYEPNGLTYSTANGDPTNCRACTFTLVKDIAQCNAGGQSAATTITTNYLPPASVVPSSTTTAPAQTTSTTLATKKATTTSCKTTSTSVKTTSTTSAAAVVTPRACGDGYCKVNWLSQADCYVSDCGNCPWGTYCQQYQSWPWALSACLPARIWW